METISSFKPEEPSFRDPSGFIFRQNGNLYRCINYSYKDNYEHLIGSGLSEKLIADNQLLPFEKQDLLRSTDSYCVIKPKFLEFISYPYEWSFSQLKDAALLTLRIAKTSLDYDMELKDASAYNIQFVDGQPQLIDTLSFTKYESNSPWIAYRQFCQHFLAPLLLMKYKDIRLNSLLKLYIDGIPLDLAVKILGFRKYMPGAFFHLNLQNTLSGKQIVNKGGKNTWKFSKKDHLRIIDSLTGIITGLSVKLSRKYWGDYYEAKILSEYYLDSKQKIVEKYISTLGSEIIYDFGSNNGLFSRIASKYCPMVISADVDPECVEINYLECKAKNEKNILPLILDLSNPSPSIGWNNTERDNFFSRMKIDTILALALVHHLIISNNIPMLKLASFFSSHCNKLIIEYVPMDDPKVKQLLQNRENIFQHNSQPYFEECFRQYFTIIKSRRVEGSDRIIYLMEKKNA